MTQYPSNTDPDFFGYPVAAEFLLRDEPDEDEEEEPEEDEDDEDEEDEDESGDDGYSE
jgi:hypothetical protein